MILSDEPQLYDWACGWEGVSTTDADLNDPASWKLFLAQLDSYDEAIFQTRLFIELNANNPYARNISLYRTPKTAWVPVDLPPAA